MSNIYIGDSNFDTQISSDELAPEYFPTAEDLAEAGEFFAQMNDDAVAQMSDDDWKSECQKSSGHHAHGWLNPDRPNEDFDWLFIQA